MRRLALPLLALIAMAALAACGGTAATNAPATASAGAPQPAASQPGASPAAVCATAEAPADANVTVDIKDFAYAPEPVVAKVGDVIAWTNSDSVPHTASLMDGSCTTDQLATGITGALVFNVAGTYTYQCNVHPSQMKDYTIEVQ